MTCVIRSTVISGFRDSQAMPTRPQTPPTQSDVVPSLTFVYSPFFFSFRVRLPPWLLKLLFLFSELSHLRSPTFVSYTFSAHRKLLVMTFSPVTSSALFPLYFSKFLILSRLSPPSSPPFHNPPPIPHS